MSPSDLSRGYRTPPTGRQLWRWLVESVWRVEHAFERSRAKDRPVDDARLRIFLLLVLVGLAFTTVAFEAGKVALFGKPHAGLGGVAEDSGARATLIDREGQLLATDIPRYDLYLDPRDVAPARREETRTLLLQALPRIDAGRIDAILSGAHRTLLVAGLGPAEKAAVRQLGRPGLEFQEAPKRVYPLGAAAAHLIGFAQSGGAGLAGAELALDPLIKANGVAGQPVQLSLDLRVQAALEDELRQGVQAYQAVNAVGLVTDTQTGEILAMASLPDFDPANRPAQGSDALSNHAAQSDYEMGSTFKVFTFALGLDSRVATMASTFDASHPLQIGDEKPITDFHGQNRVMSMSDIFINSSNIGTGRLALAVGAERMERYFRAFGLFDPAPVELVESRRPILPRVWTPGVVARASFGHAIAVSPLNVAAGIGSIVNGGVYTPLTIQRRPDGPIPGTRRVISPETSRLMLDLLRLNVSMGTGAKADASGLSVGGKTGTANKLIDHKYVERRYVSSFVSVFPTDGPATTKRYLVLVLFDDPKPSVERGGTAVAGFTAAPVAGRVIDRIAPFLGVNRQAVAAGPKPLPAALVAEAGGEAN